MLPQKGNWIVIEKRVAVASADVTGIIQCCHLALHTCISIEISTDIQTHACRLHLDFFSKHGKDEDGIMG